MYVVGPRLTNARGVFVEFWSFCIGFYITLCVSRRAYGSCFLFYRLFVLFNHSSACIFTVFFVLGGGWRGHGWVVVVCSALLFSFFLFFPLFDFPLFDFPLFPLLNVSLIFTRFCDTRISRY